MGAASDGRWGEELVVLGEDQISLRASVEEVLAVLGPVERWALLLPGFRRVRFIGRQGAGVVVDLWSRRGPLPLRWTAEHLVLAEEGRVVHRHLRGLATGLTSECRLTADGEWLVLRVGHTWQPGWPLIGPLVARLVVAWLARPITRRTLAEIARLAAADRAALCRLEAARRQQPGLRTKYHRQPTDQ